MKNSVKDVIFSSLETPKVDGMRFPGFNLIYFYKLANYVKVFGQ